MDQLTQENLKGCLWSGISNEGNPKRGIAQAHKQIVKYAKDQRWPSITIAEDDFKFTDTGAYDYFLNRAPRDFDLYLASIYHGIIKPDNSVDDFAGLTLYIISQRFYDTFLSIPEGNDIDRELAGKGKFIVCNPFVAIQHNGYSDNKRKHINYDDCLHDRELFQTRSLAAVVK